MSWPSHRAQTLGAKLPVKILISAKNGFDMILLSSVLRREYSLKRNNEIQHQIRGHVLMGLVASRGRYTGRIHGCIRRPREHLSIPRGPQVSSGTGRTRI